MTPMNARRRARWSSPWASSATRSVRWRSTESLSAHLQERKGRAAIDFKEVVALPGGPDSIVEMALAGIVSFDEAAFERWREVPGSDVKRHLIDVIERNMQRADPTYALIVEKGK